MAALLSLTLLVLAVGMAAAIGGAPERWGALIIALSVVLQIGASLIRPQIFYDVDAFSVMVDLFLATNFGMLAVHANRVWPIWATSLQILSLTAHFARAFNLGISELVYGIMKGVPTWVAVLAIALGAIGHRRVMRQHGSDPAWKSWRVSKPR